MTKTSIKNILTINAPSQNQINAPPKFHHNQIFSHVHTQLPNFSITMHKKFLHVQNSHTKIPTSTCTNKFSHSQNHNHTNSPRINITYLTIFFPKVKISYPIYTNISMHIPIKFFHFHKKFTQAKKLVPHTLWTWSYKSNPNFSPCQYS